MKKSLIPVILYCVFIFFLSSQQNLFWVSMAEGQLIGFETSSFFKHVVEYSILGVLLRIASSDLSSISTFSLFYGITDEIHQWFVPLRVLSPYDMLANSIGGLLGIITVHWGLSNKKNLEKPLNCIWRLLTLPFRFLWTMILFLFAFLEEDLEDQREDAP